MKCIADPELEMFQQINDQRRAEAAERIRWSEARKAHERAKRAFWRLCRRAAVECGSCLCIAAMMAVYTARGLVSQQVSGPIALACVAVGVWRGCQYWQILNK